MGMTVVCFCNDDYNKEEIIFDKYLIHYPVVVTSTGGRTVVSQGKVGLKLKNEKQKKYSIHACT